MDILKCVNCGAKIKKNSLKCDYCGTHYKETPSGLSEQRRTQSSYIVPKLSSEQVYEAMTVFQKGRLVALAPIGFLIVWTSFAMFGFISVLQMAGFFPAIIPGFMSCFGLGAIVSIIKGAFFDNVTKIIKTYKRGDHEKAYSIAKAKSIKDQNALLISLLLAYHIFNDYDYLEQNAIRATEKAVSHTTNYTNAFCVLVEKYTAVR